MNIKNTLKTAAARAWLVLLFLLVACYAFAALGLFSFGIVSLPCVLLGRKGVFTVISDLTPTALLLMTAGALTAGLGMCLGLIPLCVRAYDTFKRFRRSSELRKERYSDEEDTTA